MSSVAVSSRKHLLWAVLALLVQCRSSQVDAQQIPDRYQSIPGDSLSLTSIDVASLRSRKDLEIVPWEIISAFGKQELGIDPLLISSIDIAAGMPSINGPEFGVSIKTTGPVDIANLNGKFFGGIVASPKVKGMRFRIVNGAPTKVVQSEPQKVLFGTEGTLRRMMNANSKPSKIVELASASKYPFRAVTAFASVRPLMDGAFSDASGRVPPQLRDDIQIVIDELQFMVSETDFLGSLGKIELKFVASDSESANKLAEALDRLRTNGMVLAEQAILQALKNEPQVRAASKQYLQRLKEFLSKAELWTLNGNEIAIKGEFAYTVPTIAVLTGLLLPAVQAAREAARRMQSSNNLKQLMLSLHNYHDTFKQFPSRASKGGNGKPLLSWRVAVLPFIEEGALYQQFHLDEPWDSEHNMKLLDKMPATFRHPSFAGPQGQTVYLAPYYESTVWSQDKPGIAQITDGTSNTIALFEVDDGHAVPWTKPEDLDLHELDIIDCFRPTGSNVGFFDGSIQFLARDIEPDLLKALITSAGGEVTPRQ